MGNFEVKLILVNRKNKGVRYLNRAEAIATVTGNAKMPASFLSSNPFLL